jgi:hypothetical protein
MMNLIKNDMTPDILILFVVGLIIGIIWGNDYYLNKRRRVKRVIPNIPNKLRAFEKVRNVINSCRTQSQLHGAQRMLDMYWLIYGANVYWSSLYDLWVDRSFYETLPQSEEWDINQIIHK